MPKVRAPIAVWFFASMTLAAPVISAGIESSDVPDNVRPPELICVS